MEVRIIHDSAIVYEYLKEKSRFNYIYQFNNLSPEVWPKTICYGLFSHNQLIEIAMVNMNYDIPVLLAASFENIENNKSLLKTIKKFLPGKFYTHIDKATLDEVFSQNKIIELEEYMNMGLSEFNTIENLPQESEAVRLGIRDLSVIKELISISYPEAWLDDELVGFEENFGIYVGDKLVSFAGIHAYSEQYSVVAIAHITTHPDFRRRGYAEKTVLPLVKSLVQKIKFIGLNVKADNFQAINLYKKLGFIESGRFVACEITNNQ